MTKELAGKITAIFIAVFLAIASYSSANASGEVAVTKQKCTITGTNKSETIYGSNKADVICGLGGNDIIYGLAGDDVLDGGSGNDRLYGGTGNDVIYGGTGSDSVDGGTGTNKCVKDSIEKTVSTCRYVSSSALVTSASPSSSIGLPKPSPTSSSTPSASAPPQGGGSAPGSNPSASPAPSSSASPSPSSSASPSTSPSPSASTPAPSSGVTVTFESTTTETALTGFGGDTPSLAAAPSPSVTGSQNSLKVIRGANAIAGVVFYNSSSILISSSSKHVTLDIYSPAANVPVLLKLEDPSDSTKSVEVLLNTSRVGWQNLDFDFSATRSGTPAYSASVNYKKAVIFYAFNQTPGSVIYFVDNVNFLGLSAAPVTPQPTYVKGNLLWSDDFAGTGNLDSAKWTSRICGQTTANGGGSCYNNEQQIYLTNANQMDGQGNAVISTNYTTSPPSGSVCLAWTSCTFTSGRFDTQGKVSFQYGVLEARIQNPAGGANWPAFWLLGTDITSVGWPASGEIDIMEGHSGSLVSGAIHWSNSGADAYDSGNYSGSDFASAYHVYSLYWLENYIALYVDGNKFLEETPSTLSHPGNWAFNHPFFVIFNNAVSPPGGFGGTYDSWTSAQMKIDYVRYYQLNGIGTLGN